MAKGEGKYSADIYREPDGDNTCSGRYYDRCAYYDPTAGDKMLVFCNWHGKLFEDNLHKGMTPLEALNDLVLTIQKEVKAKERKSQA